MGDVTGARAAPETGGSGRFVYVVAAAAAVGGHLFDYLHAVTFRTEGGHA